MSQTITISDDLFRRLETAAQARGLSTIQQLLEKWEVDEEERRQRTSVVERIIAHRDEMLAQYGVMPDSVDLIREDRER